MTFLSLLGTRQNHACFISSNITLFVALSTDRNRVEYVPLLPGYLPSHSKQ